MESIYKRKNKDGTLVWRAIIRIKGYPTVCNHFDRKQESSLKKIFLKSDLATI